MRITRISLTNFRSFKETQTIELAPVTLLFGPNSVGKSSVLMSLAYLLEILENGDCDPSRLKALDDRHVGGFRNLVHNRDTDERIKIRVEVNKVVDIGALYDTTTDYSEVRYGITSYNAAADCETFEIELEIACDTSARVDEVYVAAFRVYLDDELVAEVSSDSGGKQPMLTYINFDSHLLIADYDHDLREEDETHVSELYRLLNRDGEGRKEEGPHEKNFDHKPIAINSGNGALPHLNKRIESTLMFDTLEENIAVHEVLSDVLVAPLDNLLAVLQASVCIGPLRTIPDSKHLTSKSIRQGDWYSGAAAWNVLQRDVYESWQPISNRVNKLIGANGLGLGYKLRSKISRGTAGYSDLEFHENLRMKMIADHTSALAKLEAIQGMVVIPEDLDESRSITELKEVVNSLEEIKQSLLDAADHVKESVSTKDTANQEIILWDESANLEVNASDVGVGVSQILPLVVAVASVKNGIISCEQPELHVHPRIQVALGDLVTQSKNDCAMLLETHSEHLILRILRRIRETAEGELPDGRSEVFPHDVSIVYLNPSSQGVTAKRIGINTEGEFTEPWPSGFFAERREELM